MPDDPYQVIDPGNIIFVVRSQISKRIVLRLLPILLAQIDHQHRLLTDARPGWG
jgi:hypothetical protein